MSRKGVSDLAPKIRGAYKRAILRLESEGKPLSGIIAKELEKDPLGALALLAKFNPREKHERVSHDHTHVWRVPDGAVSRVIEGALEAAGIDPTALSAEVEQERLVLPAPVHAEEAGS